VPVIGPDSQLNFGVAIPGAGAYKRLRRLQDQDIQFQLKRLSLSPAQARKYKKLKSEIIGEVKSLRLNRARIDALVEQLFDNTYVSLRQARHRNGSELPSLTGRRHEQSRLGIID
jgi:hypothetical protein